MVPSTVRILISEQAASTGTCELCATSSAPLEAVVAVQHERGGSVQFVACDRCARAMRRVAATLGGEGQLTRVSSTEVSAATPATGAVTRLRAHPRQEVLSAEVVAEFAEQARDEAGTPYVVRVCGGPRSDGTWVGWLEFVAVGERQVRRTGQETTQPNRNDLVYWASGLEPVYLQGAFTRAR